MSLVAFVIMPIATICALGCALHGVPKEPSKPPQTGVFNAVTNHVAILSSKVWSDTAA